jgi:6-phosphogluconolactonase (cycloisomerase 2 family)
MKLFYSSVFVVVGAGFSACGGGGGSGGGGGAPPANLTYTNASVLTLSRVELTPLTPTVQGVVDEFTVSPALPAGLALDVDTGVISGTPDLPAARRLYAVRASNLNGSTEFQLALEVAAPARYVLGVSDTDDSISAYAADSFTGALTRHGYHVQPAGEDGIERIVAHPSGRFAYAPNLTTGNVSVLAVDPVLGEIESSSSVPCGVGPHDFAVTPDGRFAYCTSRGSNQLFVFSVDNTTGALTQVGAPVTTGTQPSALCVEPAGNVLFVTMRGQDTPGDDFGLGSEVQSYSINQTTGALTTLGLPLRLNGGRPIALAIEPQHKVLFLNLEAFDTVLPVRYNATNGSLVPVSLRDAGSAPVAVAAHPSTRFLYVVTRGEGAVRCYTIHATTGAVTQFATVPAGTEPVSITLNPLGTFAYVSTVGSREVLTFAIHPTTGALTLQDSLIGRGAPRFVGTLPGVSPLRFEPRFVHVTAAESDELSAFSIDATTGALAQTGFVAATDANPRSLAVHPGLGFAYTANADGGSLGIYSIDAQGALTSLGSHVLAGKPEHVTIDPSGRFLYVAARDVLNVDDGWLSTFAINATTGALTPLDARQVGARPAWVGCEPAGEFLYVANAGDTTQGSSNISVFRVDVETGVPAPSAANAAAPGIASIGFHPGARQAYAALPGSDVIARYAINRTTGALTAIPPPIGQNNQPAMLTFSPNGHFAYAAMENPASNGQLAAYLVGPDGDLDAVLQSLPDGLNPVDLGVDPSGRFLYSANRGSDNVSILVLDPASGLMSPQPPVQSGLSPSAIVVSGLPQ